MVYANGDTYEGGWANDMREGIGAFYCISKGRNTLVYTGEWSRDKPSGYGVFYGDHQCRYEGQWVDGRRSGKGKLMMGSQALPIYEGEWLDDVREGHGTERYPNGDVFVGRFSKDVKHEKGSFFFTQKRKRLDGVWKNGSAVGGSYSSLSHSDDSDPRQLPVLELRDPEEVLTRIMQQCPDQS